VLTGGAAIISAVAALIVALTGTPDSGRLEVEPAVSPSPVASPESVTPPASTSSETARGGSAAWPVLRRDEFNGQSGWWTGETQNESFDRFGGTVEGGIYRLSFRLRETSSDDQWVSVPYPASAEFAVDLDVRITMKSSDRVFAGLSFGGTGEGQYRLWVDDNECGLMRLDGAQWTELVTCVSPIDLTKWTRVGVAVESGFIRGFIDSVEVFEYREPSFTGGNITLATGSDQAGDSGLVEFDNVEFRRKP
jgi:hypothetical protein